jgi:DNA-directed RNA polymerase subunit RPC12/RpoP
MIQFVCPRCDSTLSASSRKVGTVCSCPKCHHRLQVPTGLNGADQFDADVEPVARASVWKTVLFGLRLVAWAGCLTLVAFLVRPYLGPLGFDEASAPDGPAATGSAVLLVGAYITARAVDSLTHL